MIGIRGRWRMTNRVLRLVYDTNLPGSDLRSSISTHPLNRDAEACGCNRKCPIGRTDRYADKAEQTDRPTGPISQNGEYGKRKWDNHTLLNEMRRYQVANWIEGNLADNGETKIMATWRHDSMAEQNNGNTHRYTVKSGRKYRKWQNVGQWQIYRKWRHWSMNSTMADLVKNLFLAKTLWEKSYG